VTGSGGLVERRRRSYRRFAHRHFLAADLGDIGAANEQRDDDEGDQQEDAGNEKYRRTRRLSEFGEEGKVGLCRVASQGHG
jgi:hypothetical protein